MESHRAPGLIWTRASVLSTPAHHRTWAGSHVAHLITLKMHINFPEDPLPFCSTHIVSLGLSPQCGRAKPDKAREI
ncbi:hypothetical protein PoB_006455200 [Plakobranchus ocellatus]|uniref:Uncharacterized protein n=1 Tax=Plakobranchus ocellatus TaxID=259542 RepID=A0AAV4D1I2_9GAST|nr:hypothetical protein PoB_006455200 [Plakobranchus ocellatus]